MIKKFQGKLPEWGPGSYVDESACLVGDVVLGAQCSVWCNASLRGDFGPIRVGHQTNIQDNAVFHTDLGSEIVIGDLVSIGHGAIVHGARVGDRTLIGMNATILDGAVIGKDCIIGAGALVTGGSQIPDGSLVVGVPGKVVRPCRPEEIAFNEENARDYLAKMAIYIEEADE